MNTGSIKEDCLVSVIVPIFNAENTLRYCLDSIVKQHYSRYEVLLIDDGSTDCSSEICGEYLLRDSRFSYIKKKNGGVSSARNLGLKRCHGDYICFIDADDTISEYFLSVAIRMLVDMEADVFISDFNKIHNHDNPNKKKMSMHKPDSIILNNDEFLVNLVNGKGVGSACFNKVYKRAIIGDRRFQDNIAVAEDLFFNIEIVKNNENMKIVYFQEGLYNYFLNSDGVMHGSFSKKNLDVFEQYERILSERGESNKKFFEAVKSSLVFISCKMVIKMVSSSCYEKAVVDKCKTIIDENKKLVYKSTDYGVKKKCFLMLFNVFYGRIIRSYDKNNIWKKICNHVNAEVG